MTTPTTNTTPVSATNVVQLTDEQRKQLEAIASTYPTQDDLIVATAVFFEHETKDGAAVRKSAPLFVIGGDISKCLSNDSMSELVRMYTKNDKLSALLEKVNATKPAAVTKAKSGSGCAYTARNLD